MNLKICMLRHHIRKLLAVSLLVLLPLASVSTASAAETIRVGHFSWPGYGFLYVNEANNLSPDLNFEFTIIEDPVQLFALLGTNKLDVVFSTIEFGPILEAEDMGSRLVALTNLGYGCIISLRTIQTLLPSSHGKASLNWPLRLKFERKIRNLWRSFFGRWGRLSIMMICKMNCVTLWCWILSGYRI